MNTVLKRLLGFSALAALLSFQAGAQTTVGEDDPIFGTWELDKTRSMFFGRGPEPARQTRIYERHPDGVKSTIITVQENGNRNTAEFVSAQDGVPSPFFGASDFDEIALERRGPYDAFVKLTNGAVEIGSAWRTISRDGKRLTIRMELGDNVESVRVYNKRED